MSDTKQRLGINDLSGIYKDIADVIGIEATILLHNNFQGQQITFPKKLYTKDYIIRQVKDGLPGNNIKYIANKYGYTERRLRQILREMAQRLFEGEFDMWRKKEKATPEAETKKKSEKKIVEEKKVEKKPEEKAKENFTEKDAKKALEANREKAQALLEDEKSMDNFLGQVNEKFNAVTGLGDKFSDIPLIVSLIRAYIKGEYREFPTGSLIGLVGALIYFVSPVDAIPDFIPVIGYVDDLMVIGLAIRFAYTDLEDYKKWLATKRRPKRTKGY